MGDKTRKPTKKLKTKRNTLRAQAPLEDREMDRVAGGQDLSLHSISDKTGGTKLL